MEQPKTDANLLVNSGFESELADSWEVALAKFLLPRSAFGKGGQESIAAPLKVRLRNRDRQPPSTRRQLVCALSEFWTLPDC
jgi:hypothetical protein